MEKDASTIGSRFNGCSKRRAAANASLNISKRHASNLKRVTSLLRKKKRASRPLTKEEEDFLITNSELVKQFYKRREKRAELLRRQRELEDSPKELDEKCFKLAQAIHDAEFLIVYTGAGISTAASIPDYRGPNGIWTRLQKGKDIGHHDLTTAEPTYTHMALSYLHCKGIVRHVVSQNCDGLHLRSGLPKTSLSEVHGNMYIEVCKHCVPAREYVRTFDVTEKTSTFNHTTGRRCYRCGEPLVDTIVHFGERGRLRWPLNWQGACQAAKACDTILCLGSSLKVLRKYPWLWQMNRPPKRRPRLFVVNLQWTPKDKDADIKINGKCDDVMRLVMKNLGFDVPKYAKSEDPIFQISTALHADECVTIHRPLIKPPDDSHSISPGRNPDPKNNDANQRDFIACDASFPITPSFTRANLSTDTSNVFSNFTQLPKENGGLQDTKPKMEIKEDFENSIEDQIFTANSFQNVKTEIKEEEEDVKKFSLSLKTEEDVKEVKTEVIASELVEESPEDNEEKRLRSPMSSLSDSESIDFLKTEKVLTRALSFPLLNSLKNKEINFYGTGLCIRSTKNPSIDQASVDDEFDDSSLSSLTSDTKSEDISDAKKDANDLYDNNMDYLFVSDDSSDAVVISVEGEHFYGQTQNVTFANFNKTFDSETNEEKASFLQEQNEDEENVAPPKDSEASPRDQLDLVDEENIEEGPTSTASPVALMPTIDESILHSSEYIISDQAQIERSFNAFFADSKCGPNDGSFLLQTKIIDGVIHAATVKSLSDVNGEESLNGTSSAIHERVFQLPARDLKRKSFEKTKLTLDHDSAQNTKKVIVEKNERSLELDDDVKRLWFWGFDTRPKKEVASAVASAPAVVEPQQRRLTRSSYQKALLSRPPPQESGVSAVGCQCRTANPGLCRLAAPRSEDPEEEMVKAREAVRKRRQCNYKRFEPIFEVALESLIYERKKMRRSKRDDDDEEEEEEKKKDGETQVEVIKKSESDAKVVPGWYGKGYRKILKKKKVSHWYSKTE